MTPRESFTAWWLLVSVPTWLIVLNPPLGVFVLFVGVMVMAAS